jgi:hypothetical protein
VSHTGLRTDANRGTPEPSCWGLERIGNRLLLALGVLFVIVELRILGTLL